VRQQDAYPTTWHTHSRPTFLALGGGPRV